VSIALTLVSTGVTASAIAAETPVTATPAEVTFKKSSEVTSFLTVTTLFSIVTPSPAVYVSTNEPISTGLICVVPSANLNANYNVWLDGIY
jgi:hypothetical protein